MVRQVAALAREMIDSGATVVERFRAPSKQFGSTAFAAGGFASARSFIIAVTYVTHILIEACHLGFCIETWSSLDW
jgi:hypothetical protein